MLVSKAKQKPENVLTSRAKAAYPRSIRKMYPAENLEKSSLNTYSLLRCFFIFSLDKIEDEDSYPGGKLTCVRNPRAWLSGVLFLGNECLLNNCRTLKDQQQQQDNK